MELTAVSALHYRFAELSDILERCFQGYFVPITLTPEAFALRFTAEGMSVEDSCVWERNGEPVAIAIIARRSNQARLAAFAIQPDCRGKGLAKSLLAPLFASLNACGIERHYLEVMGANTAAIALYQALGFRITQQIIGFKGETADPASALDLQHSTPDDLLRAVYRAQPEAITWQLDPLSLTKLPCEIVKDNSGTWAALTTHTPVPQLRFLFVEPASRGQGHARKMLETLNARHPGISTPIAIPLRFTPLFTAAGYLPLPLEQYEMVWDV